VVHDVSPAGGSRGDLRSIPSRPEVAIARIAVTFLPAVFRRVMTCPIIVPWQAWAVADRDDEHAALAGRIRREERGQPAVGVAAPLRLGRGAIGYVRAGPDACGTDPPASAGKEIRRRQVLPGINEYLAA
jgi:hypothetical protein